MHRMHRRFKKHPVTAWQWYNWLAAFCFAGMVSLGVNYLNNNLIGRHQSPNDAAAYAPVSALVFTSTIFFDYAPD